MIMGFSPVLYFLGRFDDWNPSGVSGNSAYFGHDQL